jgi:hypothetical protein
MANPARSSMPPTPSTDGPSGVVVAAAGDDVVVVLPPRPPS